MLNSFKKNIVFKTKIAKIKWQNHDIDVEYISRRDAPDDLLAIYLLINTIFISKYYQIIKLNRITMIYNILIEDDHIVSVTTLYCVNYY